MSDKRASALFLLHKTMEKWHIFVECRKKYLVKYPTLISKDNDIIKEEKALKLQDFYGIIKEKFNEKKEKI